MKRKLNYILLFLLAIVLLPLGVKAEETYSIEAKMYKGSSQFYDLGVQLKGIVEGTNENRSKYSYYVKFVNKGDAKPTDGTYENLVNNYSSNVSRSDIKKWKQVLMSSTSFETNYAIGNGKISIDEDYYLLSGYDYAYVAKCTLNDNTCTVSDNTIQVTKQDKLPLGQRYTFSLWAGYDSYGRKIEDHANSIYLQAYFPQDGENGDHKVTIKFGKVTDQTLINKIANKESDATEKLLAYAKQANDKSYVDDYEKYAKHQVKIDELRPDFNAYYYLYMTFTDSNNLYRSAEIEDVYFGNFHEAGLFYEFDNGTIGKNTTSVKQMSSKVENPKTGDSNILIMVIALIGTLGVLGISYRKFKKVK